MSEAGVLLILFVLAILWLIALCIAALIVTDLVRDFLYWLRHRRLA